MRRLILFFIILFNTLAATISSVHVEGNREVPSNVILNLISFKKGDDFDIDVISEGYANLKKVGYFDDVTITPSIENSEVNITISLSESSDVISKLESNLVYSNSKINRGLSSILIESVEIEGNYLIEDREILDRLNINFGSVYSYDKVEIAKSVLERSGLFATVEATVDIKDSSANITLYLVENKYVGSVIEVRGDLSIDSEKILSVIHTKTNHILDSNVLREDESNIRELYAASDIVGIEVGIFFEGNTLVFNIVEPVVGKVYFERESYFERGLSLYTKDYVLRRYVSLEEGELIKKSKMNRSRDNLARVGLFKNVTVDIRRSNVDPKVKDIYFKLEEELGIQVNLSLNSQFNGDFKFSGGFENSNFLGRAHTLACSLDINPESKWKGRVYFYDPWIYGTSNLSFGVDLYRSNSDSSGFAEYFNNRLVTGLMLNTSFPFIFNNFRLALKNDLKEIVHYDPSDKILDQYLENSTTLSVTYKDVNNYVDPTKGIYLSISGGFHKRLPAFFNVNYSNFDNKSDIITVELSNKLYSPFIFDSNLFACNFAAGYSYFVGTKMKFSKFSLGGSSTIRGYNYNTMKGDLYFLLNIEDRVVVYDESVKIEIALFFDMGIAGFSSDMDRFANFSNYKRSFGIDFRIKKFLIPFSFHLSFPLDSDDSYIKPGYSLGYIF